MELRTAAALIGLAAVAAGFGDQLDVLDRLGGSPADQGVARVERVVDGDTIKVVLDGREETVRYIGVDTPETKKPGTPVQCFGTRAWSRARACASWSAPSPATATGACWPTSAARTTVRSSTSVCCGAASRGRSRSLPTTVTRRASA